MRILYLGPSAQASGHRVGALARLGHEVVAHNPYVLLPPVPLAAQWLFKTGALGLETMIARRLAGLLAGQHFDVALVINGEAFGPAAVRLLKEQAGKVVNLNQDNPFTARDGARWRAFLRALPEYDLFVTVRESNVEPARRAGARRVSRVWFSSDEVAHAPIELTAQERARFDCDVSFVGTWMPERGPFMLTLLEHGVPLRIYGPRWNKCPEYSQLRHVISDQDTNGRNYACAITASRISLAMLSKGNEDLHTTRSLEIPAIGGLLCGERTSEHLALYEEGREALFWSDAVECARVCRYYLDHPEEAGLIRANGRERASRNGLFNERVLADIIAAACSPMA